MNNCGLISESTNYIIKKREFLLRVHVLHHQHWHCLKGSFWATPSGRESFQGSDESDCRHITDKVKVDSSSDTSKQTNPHIVTFLSSFSLNINGPCKVNSCVSEGGCLSDSKGRGGAGGELRGLPLKCLQTTHLWIMALTRFLPRTIQYLARTSQSVSFTPLCCTLLWALCTISVVRA